MPDTPIATAQDFVNQTDAEWMDTLGLKPTPPADPPPDEAVAETEEPTGAAPDATEAAPDASAPDEAKAEGAPDEQAEGDAVELVKGEDGRWHRADGTFASAEEAAAADAQLAAPAPDAPETGSDAPKPGTIKPQGFSAHDATGAELAELPDIRVTYTANGKVRENVPLDKLVRQAQSATYNAEVQQEAVSLKAKVAEVEQAKAAYEAQLSEMQRLYDQMLSDESDQFYIAARDRYRALNTPEARALRAEQELAQVRQQTDASRHEAQIAQVVQSRIAPQFTALTTSYPNVTPQEIYGQFALLTAPLLVNGKLPADRLPDVERLVSNDLTHWAQATDEQRAEAKVATDTARQAAVQKERVKVTLLKNQLARTAKPTGTVGGIRPPAPKSKPYAKATDLMDDPELWSVKRTA